MRVKDVFKDSSNGREGSNKEREKGSVPESRWSVEKGVGGLEGEEKS